MDCLTDLEDCDDYPITRQHTSKEAVEMSDQTTESQLRYASDPDPSHATPSVNRLNLTLLNEQTPNELRPQEILRIAQEAFSKTGNWVTFYREILGSTGIVRQLFPNADERRKFEATETYAQLQEMLAALRSHDPSKSDATEPERMITIRIPKSLHDALKDESEEMTLSINKLCISKLLQHIDSRFVPIQQGRRRGRRPGPQGPRKKPQETTAQPESNTPAEATIHQMVTNNPFRQS